MVLQKAQVMVCELGELMVEKLVPEMVQMWVHMLVPLSLKAEMTVPEMALQMENLMVSMKVNVKVFYLDGHLATLMKLEKMMVLVMVLELVQKMAPSKVLWMLLYWVGGLDVMILLVMLMEIGLM